MMVLEPNGQRATLTGENFHSRSKIEREVKPPSRWYRNVFIEVQHARMDIRERLHLVMTQYVELKSQWSHAIRIGGRSRLCEDGVYQAVVILLRWFMQHRDWHHFAHPAQ